MSDAYWNFLAEKSSLDAPSGLRIAPPLPSALKPFQRAITTWALRRGRAAMFEGTGLGKTLQQLSWGRAVADETDAPLLILPPFAVAEQTVAEAELKPSYYRQAVSNLKTAERERLNVGLFAEVAAE